MIKVVRPVVVFIFVHSDVQRKQKLVGCPRDNDPLHRDRLHLLRVAMRAVLLVSAADKCRAPIAATFFKDAHVP